MKILLLLLVSGLVPLCAESDFDLMVSRLERHFETQRLHIPLLGLISGLSGFARPAGVKDFKLAVFENIDSGRLRKRMPEAGLDPDWHTVIRVSSKKEHVEMLARHEDSWVRMLLVTIDQNDATVVQMSVRPNKVWDLVADKMRHH